MTTTDDRQSRLSEFDRAHTAFRDAIAAAPEASLGYLRPGDDYALGGLVHHVNAVLEHYRSTIDAIVEAGFQATQPRDRPGLFEEANARARAGLGPGEREAALAATDGLHGEVRDRVAALAPDDFQRKAPVTFEGGAEPYPTSPADILGWLTDHYREHVPHAEELLSGWLAR
jgi:hypothetical protein